MPDYAAMYKRLYQAITLAIDILQQAQLATEEMYVSAAEPELVALERPASSDNTKNKN